MQILRVFNNNVVLARSGEHGGEVVATGRGIGFGKKQGDVLDPAAVTRVFVPAEGRDPDHSAQMLAGLPAERVAQVAVALEAVGAPADSRNRLTLVTAISDHLEFAAARAASGEELNYPLRSEVLHLYPREYEMGVELLAEINRRQRAAGATELPDSETTALALHLVNAGFSTGDLAQTYQMTGVIQQMLEIVAAGLSITLNTASISVARFITHVRYLLVRLSHGRQLDHGQSPLTRQLLDAYPREVACARQVATVVELRFDCALTEDEIAYLGLHIVRLGETQRMSQ
ncbi:PRD domain-containing protein [Corynebacterium sanguinis]|uniref:PRD domain-containing protein n=1 Tax=Corynebacterium sanguinis TaxID=2594913 RepID=UPI0021B00423|nr:PRD domain-containing protein [Corynebacterium sanguinis]MCT1663424.1 PRD domain-containing protein [Corynebacterium sanguinis]